MELLELKNKIVKKQLGNFYVFVGEDYEVIKIYLQKIAEAKNQKLSFVDEVNQLKLYSGSSLYDNDIGRCYVVRNDQEFIKEEKGWKSVKEKVNETDNILILVYTALDSRTKFYKHNQNDLVKFENLEVDILKKHVINRWPELKKVGSFLDNVILGCNQNYGRLLLEIEKAESLANYLNTDISEGFSLLYEDNLFNDDSEIDIFYFIDIVVKKQFKLAYRLWEKMKDTQNSLGVLALLYDNYRKLLAVKTAETEDVSGETGLNSWLIGKLTDKLRYYKAKELVKLIVMIQNLDTGIKQGTVPQELAFDLFFVSLGGGIYVR